jgi:hypothetical protein
MSWTLAILESRIAENANLELPARSASSWNTALAVEKNVLVLKMSRQRVCRPLPC